MESGFSHELPDNDTGNDRMVVIAPAYWKRGMRAGKSREFQAITG